MAHPSPRAFSLLLLVPFFSFISTVIGGGLVGVNYGRMADNLMPPGQVVELLKKYSVGAVNIYDADETVLRAFASSGIKVAVALPNEFLDQAAGNTAFAADWVRKNVAAYMPDTQIHAIAVGNEVFHCCPGLMNSLAPAMQKIADALASQGLGDAVKVSTPVAFDAVTNSFPPSDGTFRESLQPVMREILALLSRTGSYLMVNIYTYQTYIGTPKIDLDYALGRAQNPVEDTNTKLRYYSLLDAQLDAVYSAMGRLGFGNAVTSNMESGGGDGRKWVDIKETGWPHGSPRQPPNKRTTAAHAGKPTQKAWSSQKEATYGGNLNASLAEASDAATVENAQAYNANLIKRILAGRTGTPLHPDADMDVYIFSLFDENLKPGDPTERSYGLFYPNGQPVYDFSFTP